MIQSRRCKQGNMKGEGNLGGAQPTSWFFSGWTRGNPRCLPGGERDVCMCAVSETALTLTVRSDPEGKGMD